MSQRAAQEQQADDGVVRALSVAKTVLDAGPSGITRAQLRERVESYRELKASGQDDDSFERMFGRDKEYLRASGVPLTETSDGGDYRYGIDPEEYGLPDLRLTPSERLALRRAQVMFAHSNVRGLEHALWALSPEGMPAQGSETEQTLQASIGSEQEIERLLELSALAMRIPLTFQYTGRGRQGPAARHVVGLGVGARGHWYLYGYDLDRLAPRIFRLDRIHSNVRPLKRLSEEQRRAAEAIAAGTEHSEADVARALEEIPAQESRAALLQGIVAVHTGTAPKVPRLRPVTPRRSSDAAEAKVERVINMAALLLSGQEVRPSELLRRFSITPEQLQRDLLSLSMTGTFGDSYSGDYLEVHPAPPLEAGRFHDEYLAADAPVELTGPAGAAVEAMARPVSLTRHGALGVLIALKALVDFCPPEDEHIADAARTLQRKIADVVPAELVSAAESMALARTPADVRSIAAARAAIRHGHSLRLRYTDAEGRTTERTIEPVQIVQEGPSTYMRAWCREARGERLFQLGRIEQLDLLPEEPRGPEAAELELTEAQRPRAARSSESIDVVLRFAPPAAGTAERFAPERIHRDKEDGTVMIATHFRSSEAAIGYVMAGGGDIEVLQPAELREQVHARAAQELAGQEASG
ncbi:helix-turn-helix transcriptional regulator [Nesterenkonia populi]|uniref:helix-turn-helix transcriptional regulator n=1 Tax=Nesterenkonia populi TaxID=1591087 RepID=UPI0011BDF508|nr:WYL domain-containing protein [Nesterenkonia populi]